MIMVHILIYIFIQSYHHYILPSYHNNEIILPDTINYTVSIYWYLFQETLLQSFPFSLLIIHCQNYFCNFVLSDIQVMIISS